jgi:hypothetical protein
MVFLLGALLFFSSSLAFIKNKENQPDRVVTFGIFVLIISVYFLSRGITSSKFWPTLKVMLLSYDLLPLFIVAGLASLILVTYTSYRLATDIRRGSLPDRYIGYMPLIIFILLVLAPYLSGLVESKVERERLNRDDYTVQSVDIITDFTQKRFKDIIILKKLDKGLILRVFADGSENSEKFVFINWGAIKQIIYKDTKNHETETM